MARGATIETVAIPWLHVIREHPALLEKYTYIFKSLKRTQSISRNLLSRGRAFAVHARNLIRLIENSGHLWFSRKKIPSSLDFLFISHLLSPSQQTNSDDFYFGDIPEKLVARGFTVAIALINHTDQKGSLFINQWDKSGVERIILSHSLALGDELKLHQRLRRESNRLRREANRQTKNLSRMVYQKASEEAISGGALAALRVGYQIGRLVAQTRAKNIVLTHEGYSWERVCFSKARGVDPKIKCIGYQHSAIFKLQHALRRCLSFEYNPDQIVTAGLIGKRQLKKSPGLRKIPITILGSNRATPNKNQDPVPSKTKHNISNEYFVCLVLPEGISSECHLLFDFAVACAKAFTKAIFIWRLHPVVDFQSLCRKNMQLKKLPNNISISQTSLSSDFVRSNIVLYRGSTSAVQAVAAGLRPIYFQVGKEMSIDPIYEMQHCIPCVRDVFEFSNAIKTYSFSCSRKDSCSRLSVLKYSRRFFSQPNAATLARVGRRPFKRSD